MLTLDPAFPLLQALAIGALAIAAGVWLHRLGAARVSARRGYGLIVLRGLTLTGIALLLLNPVRTQSRPETGRPLLLVLLDNSQSMGVKDVGGEARYQAAHQALFGRGGVADRWDSQFQTLFFRLAARPVRQERGSLERLSRPDGESTALGEGLAGALGSVGDAPSGGILLLSDGRNHGQVPPTDLARQARARRFPVFTVSLGTTATGRDLGLVNRRPQVYPGLCTSLE